MYRIISYRGFEIHVSLAASADDLYDVSFRIKGGGNLGVLGQCGRTVMLNNGPFTRHWSYLIAECAGQAAIDRLLAPANDEYR